ncbi:MAG TPA: c-type cytochrome [Cyclobacteriaceae bacterium]|jgi:thiosulfate dehydrogenase|nr:c-type cytochrome [Cyclobacteriaceae bacterium]HRF33639.1 c-type cytochrome [Cyclobacteriaceae bacterium]
MDQNQPKESLIKGLSEKIGSRGRMILLFVFLISVFIIGARHFVNWVNSSSSATRKDEGIHAENIWRAPDDATIPTGAAGEEIRYGKELIAHTSDYLGPNGKVMAISNGMNCQNCHLDAGTKPFGNNYSAVASTYPRFRARSGTEETIEKRVNDCLERSLNGRALSNESREMKAIVKYIKWLGTGVPKGETPNGAGLVTLAYLNIPADPVKGKIVFDEKCVVCHGKNGEGIRDTVKTTSWMYPPLWGNDSYNEGAGLFRLSRFAGYIKANMPLGANYTNPQLTDEEAWNIAAYVNSLPRPKMNTTNDWPDISKKPIDHPFGPYADSFSERQHKYGPFKPIAEEQQSKK